MPDRKKNNEIKALHKRINDEFECTEMKKKRLKCLMDHLTLRAMMMTDIILLGNAFYLYRIYLKMFY